MNRFLLRAASCWLLAAPLLAQSPYVGMTYYEDLLRNAQLLEQGQVNASLCIRPLHWQQATAAKQPFARRDPFAKPSWGLVRDTTLGPWVAKTLLSSDTNLSKLLKINDIEKDKPAVLLPKFPAHAYLARGRVALSILPYEVRVRYTSHHPYGWQDGPMIPNVGLQVYQSAGVYAKMGWLEAQYRPEFVRAQNKPFMNPPVRQWGIDMPDRFGTEPYAYRGMGQSYLKVNTRYVGAGVSSENLWWGPGRYSSLLMSNNAPGFTHATIHSNRPIATPLGKVEFQAVGSQLKFSGFYPYAVSGTGWPQTTPDIERNDLYDAERKNFTGLSANLQPKWFPGLYLGVNRSILYQADSASLRDLLQLVAPFLKVVSGEDGGARNQIVSFYFRYLFPESNAEIYAEFGREDAAWDVEDLLSDLTHTKAYLLGFRKIQKGTKKGHWRAIDFEMTEIAQGLSSVARARGYSWYVHGPYTNYTHMGQVLGAGAGPGSSMQTGGFTFASPQRQWSFHLERYEHNKETYYYQLPYLQLQPSEIYPDISKRWVDVSAILGYQQEVLGWIVQARLQVMQTWNFNWQYDPNETGGRFRHPGLNATTPHLNLNAIYRF